MADKQQTTSEQKCICDGTGQVVVCGLCKEGIRHSNCDDTYTIPCQSCQSKRKAEKINRGSLKGGL